MGRKKVLTDEEQRRQNADRCRRWRESHREQYRAYQREYQKQVPRMRRKKYQMTWEMKKYASNPGCPVDTGRGN